MTSRAVALYEKVTPIVRANQPKRRIILGGGDLNNIDEMLTLPDFGPQIAFSFQYSDLMSFPHQQAEWTIPNYPASIWGIDPERAADDRDISWSYWAYGAEFDLRDFSGYEWYSGLYSALMDDP